MYRKKDLYYVNIRRYRHQFRGLIIHVEHNLHANRERSAPVICV